MDSQIILNLVTSPSRYNRVSDHPRNRAAIEAQSNNRISQPGDRRRTRLVAPAKRQGPQGHGIRRRLMNAIPEV